MEHKYINELQHSSSPYLLQHAHNPVNWIEWNENVTERASREQKLILISIGYAACHWCHVMEHESFEDMEVAEVMNRNFVCVKVDREERPDVDHYYMSAVQMMQMQGGWPLNVIALPDGKPIWGGTYFPKESWMKNLQAVSDFYRENRKKTEEYAANLQKGLIQVSIPNLKSDDNNISLDKIKTAVQDWKTRFDFLNGGRKGHPKFPMPVNLDFLLNYGTSIQDDEVLDFVKLTLLKMARGGIYDQIGGGFARYSVDELWKVPHFEKMLYDNGQLLSVYSRAYQLYKIDELKTAVYETIDFIVRDMMHETGAFYSSLDADSDGVEGKYYVWKSDELQSILKDDYKLFSKYYHVNELGYWENGENILLRTNDDVSFAEGYDLDENELKIKVAEWKKILLEVRAQRIKPGVDDKVLTSWNALMIQGLANAYKAFGEDYFLQLAIKNARFIKKNVLGSNGHLWHSWKDNKAKIDGFLEDYVFTVQAFITLFEVSSDEIWLADAQLMIEYAQSHFLDAESGLFYFAEKESDDTVLNHFQNEDNVTPASNSVMANNLFHLGLLLGNSDYLSKSKKMVNYFSDDFNRYPMAYSNWGALMLKQTFPYYEVAICGKDAKSLYHKMQQHFYPNVLWVFSSQQSDVPLLKNRFSDKENLIYVCQDGACKLPVGSVEEAIKLLQ